MISDLEEGKQLQMTINDGRQLERQRSAQARSPMT